MNAELIRLMMSQGWMETTVIALLIMALAVMLFIGVRLVLKGIGYLEQNLNRLHDRVSKLEKRTVWGNEVARYFPTCKTPLQPANNIGPLNTDPVWKCYTCGYWLHRSYEEQRASK